MIEKFTFLQRIKDGVVLDIPTDQVDETLKRGGFKRMIENVLYADSPMELPKKVESFECPLCGKMCKNQHGLKIHKASHV